MRRLLTKSSEKEEQPPWFRAAQKSSWPNNLASKLILTFCKFSMLPLCTQRWKLFKLLNVYLIILKLTSMFKWRDSQSLQVTHLLRDFRMSLSSSKSRSEWTNNWKCLRIKKRKDLLSMKVFMIISGLHLLSLHCVALKSDTCLWILFSSRFFSNHYKWTMFYKNWSSQMILFNIVTLKSFGSSVLFFVTTKPTLFAYLTLVETFMLSMTHLRLTKPWLKHWKSKRQG